MSMDKCAESLDGLVSCMLGKLFVFKAEKGHVEPRDRAAVKERQGVAPNGVGQLGMDDADRSDPTADPPPVVTMPRHWKRSTRRPRFPRTWRLRKFENANASWLHSVTVWLPVSSRLSN